MCGNLIVFVGFVYGAVSISDYTASNGEMIGKVESTYNVEVIATFNVLFQYLPGLRKISRNLSHNRRCSDRHFNWLPCNVVVVCVCLCVWRPQHYTWALRHEYVRGLEVKLHSFRISALDGRCMITIGAGRHIWTLCDSIHGQEGGRTPKSVRVWCQVERTPSLREIENLFSVSPYFATEIPEKRVCSSENSVNIYQTVWPHISDDGNHHYTVYHTSFANNRSYI
jgi:hypothetical protein